MVEIDEKQVYSIIQKAKESGSIRIGVNEVTKAIERGQAKLVATASDVSPAEIVAHIPGLCSEMKAIHAEAGNRSELGASVGIKSTTAVAVLDAGSAKKDLENLQKDAAAPKKKEEPTAESDAKEQAPAEEKVEEAPATSESDADEQAADKEEKKE